MVADFAFYRKIGRQIWQLTVGHLNTILASRDENLNETISRSSNARGRDVEASI